MIRQPPIASDFARFLSVLESLADPKTVKRAVEALRADVAKWEAEQAKLAEARSALQERERRIEESRAHADRLEAQRADLAETEKALAERERVVAEREAALERHSATVEKRAREVEDLLARLRSVG